MWPGKEAMRLVLLFSVSATKLLWLVCVCVCVPSALQQLASALRWLVVQ